MSINQKIRQILKEKERQRQALICKGKGAEARPSLPYNKYSELIAPGGGGAQYNTTYTLDESGRVSSITYRFPAEVASIPIVNDLGTDININYDNYHPAGQFPSGYDYNYNNSKDVKRIWLGNETLAETTQFTNLFMYAYIIAPNLKTIGRKVANFCQFGEVGEFPELEAFLGGHFYLNSPTPIIEPKLFPKLKILGVGSAEIFANAQEIYLPTVKSSTSEIGGSKLKILKLEGMETVPNWLARNAVNLEQLWLGQVKNNVIILNNHKNPAACTIYLKAGSNTSFVSSLTGRGFVVVEV